MKEELLLTVAQEVPILPPVGPQDREQTFRPGRRLVETMSPSVVSSTRKTLTEVSFLHTLDDTWLWNVLGAHSSLGE